MCGQVTFIYLNIQFVANWNISTNCESNFAKLCPFHVCRYDVGKKKFFTVYSSQPLSYINYYVVGRGNILESGHINLEPEKPKDYNLTLTPAYTWIPRFQLYVSYVDQNGNYIHAEQTYYVENQLENQVQCVVSIIVINLN